MTAEIQTSLRTDREILNMIIHHLECVKGNTISLDVLKLFFDFTEVLFCCSGPWTDPYSSPTPFLRSNVFSVYSKYWQSKFKPCSLKTITNNVKDSFKMCSKCKTDSRIHTYITIGRKDFIGNPFQIDISRRTTKNIDSQSEFILL